MATAATASIAMSQVTLQKIVTNHKKREKTEAVMVTEKNLTQYALTVKRFVEILLRTAQNPQKDVKVVTVEDVTVPMIDMVVGQKRGASTVIKLDTSLEIVNQPDVMDAIEIDVEEVDPEVMIVEEEEILGQGVEIEGGGDLQLEATQEKETTEEEGQMTEELEEDLQVREALAQKVHQDVKIIRKIELDQRVTPLATPIMTVDAITRKVRIERAVDRVLEADQQKEA